MENFKFLILVVLGVLAVISVILGWKPVTKILGPTKFSWLSMDAGLLDIVFGVFRVWLKIVLAMALGYIFFLINVVKFIVKRVKEKKARDAINAASAENKQANDSVNT